MNRYAERTGWTLLAAMLASWAAIVCPHAAPAAGLCGKTPISHTPLIPCNHND